MCKRLEGERGLDSTGQSKWAVWLEGRGEGGAWRGEWITWWRPSYHRGERGFYSSMLWESIGRL